ncbi:hypothetical protein GCM10010372_09430 [Streptomyces tauricus]|nr:hypothetical protein GCM10010372_09430 [Streptomyces tauricus]
MTAGASACRVVGGRAVYLVAVALDADRGRVVPAAVRTLPGFLGCPSLTVAIQVSLHAAAGSADPPGALKCAATERRCAP